MLGLSHLFAYDEETLANPYTAYHVAMVRGFISSIWCFCAFNLFRDILYRCGKPRDPTLYMILEPFSIILRLAVLYIYIVYGLKNRLPHALKLIYFSTYGNWWKNKDEPFLTNASLVNALLAWWCYIVFFILFFYFCFAGIVLLLGSILGGRSFRRDVWGKSLCPALYNFFFKWLPMAKRRYIWGLSEWQLENPNPLLKKCHLQKTQFKDDDKIAYFNINS